MRKVDAIQDFLLANAKPYLSALYTQGMEVQLNVSPDGGEKVQMEYDGRQYSAYTDGNDTWTNCRIPWSSSSNPEYDLNSVLKWNIVDHCEAIALTGWDWYNKLSRWVVYDLDSIINHTTKGHTENEIDELIVTLFKIPWIGGWKSKSGVGRHLKVEFAVPPKCDNHNQHTDLAYAILDQMSAITGIQLRANIDNLGTTHFIWHRDAAEDGFELLRHGDPLVDIPDGWEEYKNRRTLGRRGTPCRVGDADIERFGHVQTSNPRCELEYEHKKHMSWLSKHKKHWWWDRDNWLLVCHTSDLATMHEELKLKGAFKTATSRGTTHNCFCHPLPDGAWAVRRFSQGVQEADTWADKNGWTFCLLNSRPTIDEVLTNVGANKDGTAWILDASQVERFFSVYGDTVGTPFKGQYKIRVTKDGHYTIKTPYLKKHKKLDTERWKKDGRQWVFYGIVGECKRTILPTDTIRVGKYTIEDKKNVWLHLDKELNVWNTQEKSSIKDMLLASGLTAAEANIHCGELELRPWRLVSIPFTDEYPGIRHWNLRRAQFSVAPNYDGVGFFPTWEKVFSHIGKTLTPLVLKDEWCRHYGIKTGAHYLKLWVAFMLRNPHLKLPYLGLFSPHQNTGKTSLWECLQKLMIGGHIEVSQAIMSSGGFSGELAGKVLGVIDDKDLGSRKQYYERAKSWTTNEEFLSHPKGATPFMSLNYLHFIHTCNSLSDLPIWANDLRVMVIRVDQIDRLDYIPKDTFAKNIEAEKADFLAHLLQLDLPPCHQRLALPILSSPEREALMKTRTEDSILFTDECCNQKPGHVVTFADLYSKYVEWCATQGAKQYLNRKQFRLSLVEHNYLLGDWERMPCVGNLSLDVDAEPKNYAFSMNGDGILKKEKHARTT